MAAGEGIGALRRPAHAAFVQARASFAVSAGMVTVAVLIIVLWAAASVTKAVGSPVATFDVLVGAFGDGSVWPHARATFAPVLLGFALALVSGVVAGAWLGRSAYWRAVLEPIVMWVYSTPKITLFPVFVLFFGLSLQARVAMAFIHAIFPILLGVMTGIVTIDPVLLKVRRSLRLTRRQALLKLYVPAVAPALAAGTQMGFSLAIIGVVLSELFASQRGLGRLIMDGYSIFDMDRMFAFILLLFVVAIAANTAFWLVERRFRWPEGR